METDPQLAPPVVSVVVVHDPGDWFETTLDAFASQDYPDLRHLFLVTGPRSPGDLDAVTERIRSRLPGAFVRGLDTNPGFGGAVDEVLRLVEGDNGFFLVSHDDVAPAPDVVSTLVTELYRSNAGMVGPKLVDWDEPRRLQHVGLGLDRFGEADPIVEPGEFDQEQHDAVRDVFVLPSACLLVRADLFRALGGFDPAISFHGDDVDLCWRAHLTGARVVVAPDARVRHREVLEDRRPDLNHRQLRARHRMRAVATLTGASRLLGRSVQMVALTLAELVVGLFTGRFGEAVASLRALVGLVPRTFSLVSRRRAVAPQRLVPEREVLGLQVRGSARLSSFLRGRETTTYVSAGTTVRRWREASFGPLLAWVALLAALVIGSRSFFDRGVPVIGEFLPFPDSPGGLIEAFGSGWDPRSFGATVAVPTGWLLLALGSVLALFRMDLAMTLSVVGGVVLGAAGTWRLATVFPVTRARIVALVVYAGTPLIPGVMATGRWSTIAWYAALPWCVQLLRRCAAIETADPAMDAVDLTDGVVAIGTRERVRRIAALSVAVAITAAFAPVTIALWLVAGLVLAVATVLARGSLVTAGWMAASTAVSVVAGAALNLPWSTTWSWSDLAGPARVATGSPSALQVASLALDDRPFTVLALALYVPLLAALAITRAWRLTWAVRGAALVVVFGGLAVLAASDATSAVTPDPGVLLVPVALGLALGAAAISGGLRADVLGRGFGWRQPTAVLAEVAVAVALVPGLASIADGAWDAPRTTVPVLLSAQLPADPPTGDDRVLYLGDPRALPVPSREYRDGIAYATVDDGPLEFTDRWAAPDTDLDAALVSALDRIADGSTLRAGRLLGPLGIRWVIVPETSGVVTTEASDVPVPVGLLDALGNQLDLGAAYGPPNVQVFQNRAWIPTTALLTGPTAAASALEGEDELVRADLSAATPVLIGSDHLHASTEPVEPGVLHVGVPFDDRWHATLDGADLAPRAGFGLTNAYDVPAAGTVTLGYDTSSGRVAWLLLLAALWAVALVASSRTRSPFGRWRTVAVTDETLIDFGDAPLDLPPVDPPLGDDEPWPDLAVDPEADADDGAEPPTTERGATW